MTETDHIANAERLASTFRSLDSKGYGAYKQVRGSWDFADFTLHVDWVQGDPFAAPSRLRAVVPRRTADLPPEVHRNRSRAVGTAAFLARAFQRGAEERSSRMGSGKSGVIRIDAPGQEVLETTALSVGEDGAVEVRFQVGLPARGRRIRGGDAARLVCELVPGLVRGSCRAAAHDPDELRLHAEVNEDADVLRAELAERGWLAFVADEAVLPRRSGIDDRPLRETPKGGTPVPFQAPESLGREVVLPNSGTVTGMAIPIGVTVIVGGGYHGKSTLLRALERGVYNHRPGDGRERVVTDPAAVKVRAEDGRSVAGVDISGFIGGLPTGEDTRSFSTANASGSTSQAAAIAEALEAGARALLVDEDTAATNFMIRDRRMQALVPGEQEPITPYIDRVRELSREHGVSSVLVIGGSGDYLEVADTVIAMRDFRPHDATERAHEVVAEHPTGRDFRSAGALKMPAARVPVRESIDPSKGKRAVRVRVRDGSAIEFGRERIELGAVEQLVSRSQVRAVSLALVHARERWIDDERPLTEVLDRVMEDVEREGLDVLSTRRPGDLAAFRRFELAAVLGRLRGLRMA